MNEPLAQQILDLVYNDSAVRRNYKDSLSDWLLDTHARGAELSTKALLDYLSLHQPDLLARLKINVRVQDGIAAVLNACEPS
jgi:hypothetical protein